MKEIPVLLLTGYLGSGKTTLLNHILKNEKGIRFAVIVNDIGEVNIDEALIKKGGIVGADPDSPDLVALQNGCICCTLQMDLVEQLTDLVRSGDFDYIIIEASGICEPEPIAQTICSIPRMAPRYSAHGIPRLTGIVTVVDALRLKSEFSLGDSLSGDIGDDDIENLIIQQIEFCNIILLNKASEVTPDELRHLRNVIRALQPRAEIIECDYADVDPETLLKQRPFNFEEVATSATWIRELEKPVDADDDDDDEEEEHHHHHHEHEHEHEHEHGHHHHHHHHGEGEAEEYGIQTMVYFRRKPFDLTSFDRLIARNWPKNIIRTKGILYFKHNRDMSYLFEQAGTQKKLTEAGLWYATAPEEELRRIMLREPGLARDWDPDYGDRMIKLVIIGQNLDRHAIEEMLDACLAKF
ncbi:MAG: GTP-binding protein [Bacteroidales bacterium]|nr:GTP-binding protein [Bacteroidales bacterium]